MLLAVSSVPSPASHTVVAHCPSRVGRRAGRARDEIAITAAGTRQAHERHWEIVWGLLYRNLTEPSAAPVLDANKAAYLGALTAVADRLAALNTLKPELDRPAAVDLLWFYLGRPAWYTLVGERGWDFDRAEAWLADAAQQALLHTPFTATA